MPSPRAIRRAAAAIALIAVVGVPLSTLAQNRSDAKPDTAPSGSRVTVVDVEGRSHDGTIESWTAEGLTLAGDPPHTFATGGILSIGTGRKARRLDGPCVILANGDRLALKVKSIEDDRLIGAWWDLPARENLRIPLEAVRGAIFSLPEREGQRASLFREIRDRRDESDLVFLARGDRLKGEFVSLSETELELKGAAGAFRLMRSEARAIAFDPSLTSVPRTDRARQLLHLVDGSFLTVVGSAFESPESFTAMTHFGDAVKFPLSAIASVRLCDGPIVDLSERTPERYEYTPYLTSKWPLGVDRSVTGAPLRLRGVEYTRGLGMHSRSSVEYRLDGKFERFLATAGIDDSANGEGDVVFIVEVDGKPVFTSQPQTGKSPPIAVGPIDLKGKSTLKLTVDFSRHADIADHADWCNAVLIRSPAEKRK